MTTTTSGNDERSEKSPDAFISPNDETNDEEKGSGRRKEKKRPKEKVAATFVHANITYIDKWDYPLTWKFRGGAKLEVQI